MGHSDLGPLNRTLHQSFIEHSNRLNQTIPSDGSEPLAVPFPLAVYAEADLPDAADWTGGTVLVSDGGPGGTPVVAYSNGTTWNYTGVGDGDMLGSNNLSDLANAATAFNAIKQAASTSATGVLEIATDAETRSAASGDKALVAALIESASAIVTLTDAATLALDWEAGFVRKVTVAGDRTLGTPTNAHPGTFRTIYIIGSNTTDRTLSFSSAYGGTLPELTDIDSSKGYILTLLCITSSHFIVSAIDGSPP